MEGFTKKEWVCLKQFIEDEVHEMKENGDFFISDGLGIYSLDELLELRDKLHIQVKMS